MAIASHVSRLFLGLCSGICALAFTQPTAAQTWSLTRERPSLFEIIAVDPAAEPRWPFGTEDVAGDGLDTTTDAESNVDLRSVYADARAGRLWLRAYVSAKSAAANSTALTFFFIDTDQRVNSGGPASGQELWPALTKDPSRAGYELAIGVRGNGTLLGVFSWDATKQLWAAEKMPEKIALAERGVARDPLRLLGDDHVYAQVNLELAVAKLDERCLANIFVRTWNDQTDKLAFGDWVNSFAMTCHARLNSYGDPEILKSNSCTSDETCPAGGRCRDGICLFSYECNSATACQADQRCTGGVCVHFRDESCTSNAQCEGLVCQSAVCVTCSESGTRACSGDAVCAPDGRCLSPSAAYSGDDSSGTAGGERVQGGAFSCSLTQAGHGLTCLWLALLPLAVRWTDRRLRRLRSERGGAQ